MNIKRLMNETLVANNGELSRGLKNQLSIVSAFENTELDSKLDYLKQIGLQIYNYVGLRILEFSLENIQKVITDNQAKIETYKINPQELVKDLRKSEIALDPSKVGGM